MEHEYKILSHFLETVNVQIILIALNSEDESYDLQLIMNKAGAPIVWKTEDKSFCFHASHKSE